MFCDVESFTKVSEQLSAETIVNMLNHYFGGFDKITAKYGIEKIKTIGDAYMCAAGLDNQIDHAVRMILASLEFQEFLKSSEIQILNEYGLSLKFRIGINTGPVVSGVVGSRKYAYDIWGDAVNIAARMEQTSIPGKINISENTYQIIKDKFNTTFRGEISAKNKGAMKMYFVDSKISDDLRIV
jgi:adenylate cyclase